MSILEVENIREIKAKCPDVYVSIDTGRPRLIWKDTPVDMKTFRQIEITERLYASDAILGYVNYPDLVAPMKFLVIENSQQLWRIPEMRRPAFVDWNGKTEEQFKQITGMAKREHQDQYRLWRDKTGNLLQLFI